MRSATFNTILSFMVGFAWALLVLGSAILFKFMFYLSSSITLSLFICAIYIFAVMLTILILETLGMYKKHSKSHDDLCRVLESIDEQLKRSE